MSSGFNHLFINVFITYSLIIFFCSFSLLVHFILWQMHYQWKRYESFTVPITTVLIRTVRNAVRVRVCARFLGTSIFFILIILFINPRKGASRRQNRMEEKNKNKGKGQTRYGKGRAGSWREKRGNSLKTPSPPNLCREDDVCNGCNQFTNASTAVYLAFRRKHGRAVWP